MRRIFNKKGFTLIELIVVIAIIAILAAIATPLVTGNLDASRFGSDRSDAKLVADAIEQAYLNKAITLENNDEVHIDEGSDEIMETLISAGYLKGPIKLKYKKYSDVTGNNDGFVAYISIDSGSDDIKQIEVKADGYTLYDSSKPDDDIKMPTAK